jgi:hypothetical protein
MSDAIKLANSESMELTRRANSRTDRAEDARWARRILLLAERRTWDEVPERIDCQLGFRGELERTNHRATHRRTLQPGFGRSRHRAYPGNWNHGFWKRPGVRRGVKQPTEAHATLGAHLDVSHRMVARVWGKQGLQSHCIGRCRASNDPIFKKKDADIIGLYLNPPTHGAVLCVGEKTAIQGLDRKYSVLPQSRDAQGGTALSIFATAKASRSVRRSALRFEI